MTQCSTHPSALWLSVSILLIGCGAQNAPTSPSLSASAAASAESLAAGRPASRCVNVSAEGVATLSIRGPYNTLGADPFDVTIGDVRGSMSSFITGADPSGSQAQGAAHYTLQHTFVSNRGSFVTEDRAVCAVAGSDPYVCRVNDVLQVVRGNGVFANPGGFLTNHGTIDLHTMSLTVNLGGRVCGDGL